MIDTFTATIYVGFKEEYGGPTHTLDEARHICERYVDDLGLCVTLTPTEYIYTNGSEPGCIIGLINYPRFPDTKGAIKTKATGLARKFLKEFNQFRVTIVFTDETVMLEDD